MPYDPTYMQNLKYNTNKPVTETDSQTEEDIVFKEGRGMQGWGREESGVWNWQMQTITYIERINNKVPLPSTGNYIQYPVINHYRKDYEK